MGCPRRRLLRLHRGRAPPPCCPCWPCWAGPPSARRLRPAGSAGRAARPAGGPGRSRCGSLVVRGPLPPCPRCRPRGRRVWQRGASERASEARERDAPRCHRRPAYVRVLDEPGEACGHPGRLTYTSLRPCPWCRPRGWRSWRRGAGERASEARERVAPRCHRCASAVPPRRVPAPGSASPTSSSTLVSMLMPLMGYAPGTPSIGSRSWARPCQPARSLPAGCRRAGQRAASAVLHSGASGVPQEPGIYLFGFDNLVWYMMGILRSWFSWQGQSLCPEGRGFETRPGPSAPAPAPASAAAGHGSRTRQQDTAPDSGSGAAVSRTASRGTALFCCRCALALAVQRAGPPVQVQGRDPPRLFE